jgi:hypothetical protein
MNENTASSIQRRPDKVDGGREVLQQIFVDAIVDLDDETLDWIERRTVGLHPTQHRDDMRDPCLL